MTKTEKVSTELAEEIAARWPDEKKALFRVVTGETLNDGHYINAYDLTDKLYASLLASRTQSPAEWEVIEDSSLQAQIGEIGNQVHNLGTERQADEDLSSRLAHLASRLWEISRAVSIPAPERSKEELCPDCGRVKAKNAHDAANGLCPKWWGIRDADADKDCRRAALETPPLHKEGEAVAAIELGDPEEWAAKFRELASWTGSAWIAGESDDDLRGDCYSFLCTLLGFMQSGEAAARALAAPVPVPVTITPEMVERAIIAHDGGPSDGKATRLSYTDNHRMRAALTAALSAKPGEQG